MSQKIKVKRGLDSSRQNLIFDQGELIWTTDKKELYIGDGITLGGDIVGENLTNGDSFTSIICRSGYSPNQNASGLYNALTSAINKTPNSIPLSQFNRYTVELYPGVYDFTNHSSDNIILNGARYIDLVGNGNRKDVIITHSGKIFLSSGFSNLENITFSGGNNFCLCLSTPDLVSTVSNLTITNCDIYNNFNIPVLTNINNSIINCNFLNLNISGGFLSGARPITGCRIENCDVFGTDIFASATIGNSSKFNTINNSRFIENIKSNSHIFTNRGAGYDYTNLIKNCYFSGIHIFGTHAPTSTSTTARFEHCHFEGSISGFQGVMEHCIIDSTNDSTLIPVRIEANSTTNNYPAFYNCKVLTNINNNVCVTGDVLSRSGYFAHSRFNKSVATGITGLFGNQFNSVSSFIK
jgi:hypothetical protein